MRAINGLKEREAYLAEHIKGRGAYFIVKYRDETELLWFTQYKNWRDDGSDWYLEAPCDLIRRKIEQPDDKKHYRRAGYIIKGDDFAYDLDCPQVSPFLPVSIEIDYLGESKDKAVAWLLKHAVFSK